MMFFQLERGREGELANLNIFKISCFPFVICLSFSTGIPEHLPWSFTMILFKKCGCTLSEATFGFKS